MAGARLLEAVEVVVQAQVDQPGLVVPVLQVVAVPLV
jgi:hypothetical protein